MHSLGHTEFRAVLTFFNTTGCHQSHLAPLNNKNKNLIQKWSKSVDDIIKICLGFLYLMDELSTSIRGKHYSTF